MLQLDFKRRLKHNSFCRLMVVVKNASWDDSYEEYWSNVGEYRYSKSFLVDSARYYSGSCVVSTALACGDAVNVKVL